MKYQVGRTGRIVVARFEDNDDVLENLAGAAEKENIKSAVFYLVGGMKEGKIVVGPEKEVFPPVPVWHEFDESHEIFGVGTIFPFEGKPKIHFHGAFGKKEKVRVGCLREKSKTFLVLEAVIIEIEGITAVREADPSSGLTLLKL